MDWLERHRSSRPLIDVGLRYWERDRECDASVIGAAVALRVFLFFVPLLLAAVGLLGFLAQFVSSKDAADDIGVSGTLAGEIDTALKQSSTARWLALLIGLFGAAWAGRTLAKTLAVASRRAWALDIPHKTPTFRVVGTVAGIVGTLGLMAIIVNRIRNALGAGLGTTVLVGSAVLYMAAWFFVSLVLPRARSDPSALLPGAVLVGAAIAVLQGFTQFYAADRISHASELYGGIGVTIVTLGWFFIIGRLFLVSFVLNAIMFERFGSLSEFVFSLPVLRRIPGRYPRLAEFFGLDFRHRE
jgi:uncharacterized BrkB/YihY/UPF0761 family membrane protein